MYSTIGDKKMRISEKEIKIYANAVSEEIFNKKLSELVFTESTTLKLSLIARLNCEEIDEDTYHQVNNYINKLVFYDNRDLSNPKKVL